MAKAKQTVDVDAKPKVLPAFTDEAREDQLISLAMNLAEERLRAGTATSQEVCHFLKLGSTRNRLEKEKIRRETELLEVKKEAVESAKRVEELYSEALAAMRHYRGEKSDEDEDIFPIDGL